MCKEHGQKRNLYGTGTTERPVDHRLVQDQTKHPRFRWELNQRAHFSRNRIHRNAGWPRPSRIPANAATRLRNRARWVSSWSLTWWLSYATHTGPCSWSNWTWNQSCSSRRWKWSSSGRRWKWKPPWRPPRGAARGGCDANLRKTAGFSLPAPPGLGETAPAGCSPAGSVGLATGVGANSSWIRPSQRKWRRGRSNAGRCHPPLSRSVRRKSWTRAALRGLVADDETNRRATSPVGETKTCHWKRSWW
jgi:hypothetical protein